MRYFPTRQFLPVFLLVLLNFPHAGLAASRAKYAGEFMAIGVGGRALGLGGAYVAVAGDVTAGYWNPSRLSTVQNNPNLAIMHTEYFSGIGKYDYASIAIPVNENKRTIGLSLIRFAVDDIPNTLYLVEPDGSVNYNNLETFSSADYAMLLSMSQVLNKDEVDYTLSVGGNVKVIHRQIGSFAKAWGFGIDAGVYLATGQWKFGADLLVASNQIFYGDWSNDNAPLPGYATVNLHSSYDVTDHVQLYGLIDNLFDSHYGLFGTFFDTQLANGAAAAAGLGNGFFTDPRTITPNQPFAAYGGVRIKF